MKSFSNYITEERSNPLLNRKESSWEVLRDYYETEKEYFVSFLPVNKIGINPKSKWATPIGIYSYNLQNSWNFYKFGKYPKPLKDIFPFAAELPYVSIFSIKHDVVLTRTSEYSLSDFKQDCDDIFLILQSRQYKKSFPNDDYQELIDNYKKLVSLAIKSAYKKHPFCYFWNLTRIISDIILNIRVANEGSNYKGYDITTDINDYPFSVPQRVAFVWNKLLRDIGYQVIDDDNGDNLIDPHESLQTLVLSKSYIDEIYIHDNIFPDESFDTLENLDLYFDMSNIDKNKIRKETSRWNWLKNVSHSEGDKLWLNIDGDDVYIDGELISKETYSQRQ